jgi:hypothetical protein
LGYEWSLGSTITGIGDSYVQFGYFGSLSFALIGYLFKTLWVTSIERKSVVSLLLMIGLISPAMIGVTHGIGRFLQEFVFQVTVVTIVAYYVRSESPVNHNNERLIKLK